MGIAKIINKEEKAYAAGELACQERLIRANDEA
jgi:hypothetical protein